MNINVVMGLMIPFLGTTLGAACVFFMKKDINEHLPDSRQASWWQPVYGVC